MSSLIDGAKPRFNMLLSIPEHVVRIGRHKFNGDESTNVVMEIRNSTYIHATECMTADEAQLLSYGLTNAVGITRTELVMVEDAWEYLTKGEMNLTEDPDPKDVALVSAMWNEVRYIAENVDMEQYSGDVDHPIDEVTDEECARRVAEAWHILHYGIAR